MRTSGEYQIDPGRLDTGGAAASWKLSSLIPGLRLPRPRSTVRRCLTAGLNARVLLIAVHALPYPLPFVCPTMVHAHLVEQLVDLASRCPLPVSPQVVLARDVQEGFRYALKPASTVLVGTSRHFWRTEEEKLARSLAREGHKVALVYIA